MLYTILLVVLILTLCGVWPSWSYSQSLGYAPSGTVGIIIIVLLVLLIAGRLR